MRPTITTVTWKFCDSSKLYPEVPTGEKAYIRGPADVYERFKGLFDGQVRERFIVFWLNTRHRVMGFEVVSEGILNNSLVHPREVFRGAIVASCASIVVAHNHPSGNTEPSREDIEVTQQLVEAGKILGIPLLDHVIHADNTYTSFAERGLV
jgi:DNA repair protein RadC